MSKNLVYDDLKLGEKAKEDFIAGKSLDYIASNDAIYLNTTPIINNLNVTDLVIAGVLAGMNTLLIGNTGCGKSQLANDILRSYFNGPIQENGYGITIEGDKELDLVRDFLKNIDKTQMGRVLNGYHKAVFWNIEEFNRCPPLAQNQFYGVGNGRIITKEGDIPIGEQDYVSSIATANFGNGEFRGTFEVDKALLNRFGIVVDFDYNMFQPSIEDEMLIKQLRKANPGIKFAPLKNLKNKILQANKEISEKTAKINIDSLAIANYIQFGLRNCQGKTITLSSSNDTKPERKGKSWPSNCQDCERNQNGDSLCSLVKEPQERTVQSMIKYASALEYLIKLKDPNEKINQKDLMFKAFELTSAYQSILNPAVLRQEYLEQNPLMMQEIINKLKDDFKANEDFIITSLTESKKGKKITEYIKYGGEVYYSSDLKQEGLSKVEKISPFIDGRDVGLSWVKELIDLNLKLKKLK